MQAAAESGGQIERIARTFGVDWPHLIAQIISFGIVCAVLYRSPTSRFCRSWRRGGSRSPAGWPTPQKIKAELARIEAERQAILTQADAEGKQLIEEARAAAARVAGEETQKAIAAAEQIIARAHEAADRDHARMLAELKREVGRLVVQTTASVTGQDPDRRKTSGASRRRPRQQLACRKRYEAG